MSARRRNYQDESVFFSIKADVMPVASAGGQFRNKGFTRVYVSRLVAKKSVDICYRSVQSALSGMRMVSSAYVKGAQ